MNIGAIREKYPQYSDMSDKQLVDALHEKYYSDIPIAQFYSMVELVQTEQVQSTPVTLPRINTHTTASTQQAKAPPQGKSGFFLVDVAALLIFGLIVFYILTYGLKGKNRDSAAKLGRWFGGYTVVAYIWSGGARNEGTWSGSWFASTLILSVVIFVIGYLVGIVKWYLFDKKNIKQPKSHHHTGNPIISTPLTKIPQKKALEKVIKVIQILKKNIPLKKD